MMDSNRPCSVIMLRRIFFIWYLLTKVLAYFPPWNQSTTKCKTILICVTQFHFLLNYSPGSLLPECGTLQWRSITYQVDDIQVQPQQKNESSISLLEIHHIHMWIARKLPSSEPHQPLHSTPHKHPTARKIKEIWLKATFVFLSL